MWQELFMIRNIPNSHGIPSSSSLSTLLDADPEDLVARLDTLRVVSCSICQANYIPSSSQGHESGELLETAFLHICHSCFRCQRSACPQCWNPVHQVCAACGEEALLPFRLPVPSLEGLVFSSSSQSTDALSLPFTCLCNGRFYSPNQTLDREATKTSPVEISAPAAPVIAPPSLVVPASASSYPSWLQEVMGYKTVEPADETFPRQVVQTLQPADAQDGATFSLTGPESQPTDAGQVWMQEAYTARPIPKLFSRRKKAKPTRSEKEDLPMGERVENILLLVTSTVLLLIGLMVAFAISSADMNSLFFHLFHVDFRAEIAYLFQLVVH
jgi:hypothetical protein